MKKVLNVYKPIGITPFQLIEKLKKSDEKYSSKKVGYAGRLDPLAYGVMVLLLDEENKNREKYLGLNKTYEFSVLFGIQTDSYDYLGYLSNLKINAIPANLKSQLSKFTKSHTGTLKLTYPPFSSKTINGVPLYKLAKKGLVKPATLPIRESKVRSFSLLGVETISTNNIKELILENLKKIKGYFRQKKTIKQWENLFRLYPNYQFTKASFKITCSSGTYVRSIANKMGEEFGCGAIAFEIFRTKVGNYSIKDSMRIYNPS